MIHIPAMPPPDLADGAVHVICARLDAPPLPLAELDRFVSDDERRRAARYLHQADTSRHIIGRALLRISLASVMQTSPESIRFHTSPLGKPAIDDGPSFNISHSGNAILIALAAEGRLGVDVEAVRDLRDLLGLARTTFAYDELCTIATLDPADRVRPFFRLWARKEAMLKALGLGLSALDAISVSADVSTVNALLRLATDGEQAEHWTIRPISCNPDVEAAVAWDRPIRSITFSRL